MTLTRRVMSGTIVAGVLAAAAIVPVLAQPQGPRGPRGERFSAVVTREQMEQIRPWLQTERQAAKPLMTLHKQLRDAVLAEAPDQGKIAALQAQIGPLQAEAFGRRVALAQRAAALLTAEQRQQLRESRFVPPFLDPAGPGGGHPPFGPGGRRGDGPGGPGAPPPPEQ